MLLLKFQENYLSLEGVDKMEDKSQFRELFIENIKKEKKVIILDDEEATLNDDGTVNFFDGISILIFSTVENFADHYFLDKHVSYSVCQYVGDTDSENNVIWHSIPSQDEDGNWYNKEVSFSKDEITAPGPNQKVYTKPVTFS